MLSVLRFRVLGFQYFPVTQSSEKRINKRAGLNRCACLLAVRLISKSSGTLKAGDFFSFIFTGRNFIFRLFVIMLESKQRDITELIIE